MNPWVQNDYYLKMTFIDKSDVIFSNCHLCNLWNSFFPNSKKMRYKMSLLQQLYIRARPLITRIQNNHLKNCSMIGHKIIKPNSAITVIYLRFCQKIWCMQSIGIILHDNCMLVGSTELETVCLCLCKIFYICVVDTSGNARSKNMEHLVIILWMKCEKRVVLHTNISLFFVTFIGFRRK